MTTTPRKYTGRETILGWFNEKRQLDVKVDEVDFSVPVKNMESNPQYNTTVVIMPKLNTMYYGNFTFNYDRIHVSRFPLLIVDRRDELTIHDLIPKINDECNVLFTKEDLVDAPLPTNESGRMVVNLDFTEESTLYYDGTEILTPLHPEPAVPTADELIAADTLLGRFCRGVDQWGIYADGNGGHYEQIITANVVACNYVETGPVSFTVSEGVVAAHEGSLVTLTYLLGYPVSDVTKYNLTLDYLDGLVAENIESIEYSYATDVWKTVLNNQVVIPRSKGSFKIRVKVKSDVDLLTPKKLNVTVNVDVDSQTLVAPGTGALTEINISRSIRESTLLVNNAPESITEGQKLIVVYRFDPVVIETSQLQLTVTYGDVGQVSAYDLTYRFSPTDTPVSMPATKIIPLTVGSQTLYLEMTVPYTSAVTTGKSITFKLVETAMNNVIANIEGVETTITINTPQAIPEGGVIGHYCTGSDLWVQKYSSGGNTAELFEASSPMCP